MKIPKYRSDVYAAIKSLPDPFTTSDILKLVEWPELCIETQQNSVREIVRQMIAFGLLENLDSNRKNKAMKRTEYFYSTVVPNPWVQS